ncbi:hypothetical protein BBK36DRAFT_1161671 [Trichoderma citrinoviride]|uniref:Uncharacterized protein n=1 Tax=Trichoderma citrinoviride TaxID=58853 RepID=A0A2T4B312_9HYPO|nr:hypothetical protein BBK36DRAFT_1161671 [Trichoderma citrinoviride]PTB63723.1 hypothetical protein BBK36DRAFT_1161671 [Trichoderma citrinoviride]
MPTPQQPPQQPPPPQPQQPPQQQQQQPQQPQYGAFLMAIGAGFAAPPPAFMGMAMGMMNGNGALPPGGPPGCPPGQPGPPPLRPEFNLTIKDNTRPGGHMYTIAIGPTDTTSFIINFISPGSHNGFETLTVRWKNATREALTPRITPEELRDRAEYIIIDSLGSRFC